MQLSYSSARVRKHKNGLHVNQMKSAISRNMTNYRVTMIIQGMNEFVRRQGKDFINVFFAKTLSQRTDTFPSVKRENSSYTVVDCSVAFSHF